MRPGEDGAEGAPEVWRVESSEVEGDYRIFRVLREWSRPPDGGELHDFFVLEAPDWVQVVPVTTEGYVVMVEQYRPGRREITLEFPAGMLEAGEDPESAARRELEEETGYLADTMELVAVLDPNPAIQTNRMPILLATGCREDGTADPDPHEDITVRLVDPADIPTLISAGTITHAHAVAAWALVGQTIT